MAAVLDFEPAVVSLRLREDAKISFPLEFKDTNGGALDVSSRTFEAQVATIADPGGTPTMTATFDYTDAATGTVVVSFDATGVTADEYLWDLWETTGSAETALIAGPVTVSVRVT